MPRILIQYLLAFAFSITAINPTTSPYPFFGPDKPIIVSGAFKEPRSPGQHTGVDFYTQDEEGWPVHTSWPGQLAEIGFEENGLGLYLKVYYPVIEATATYGHLQRISNSLLDFKKYNAEPWFASLKQNPFFEPFQFKPQSIIPLRKGSIIALIGQTGIGTPHLHIGIVNKEQSSIDPLKYFRSLINTKNLTTPITRVVFYGEEPNQAAIFGIQKSYRIGFRPTHLALSTKDMFDPSQPQVPASSINQNKVGTPPAIFGQPRHNYRAFYWG